MTQPLNYASPASYATLAESPFIAFDARGRRGWKGDRLFRVYLEPDQIYFIKIGGSRANKASLWAQFGLLGMLISAWSRKREAKKTQKKVAQIAFADPRTLLADAKENFTLPYASIHSPALHGRSWLGGEMAGKWTFINERGKKQAYTFDDAASMQVAVTHLSKQFGSGLDVQCEWNEKKKKFVKLKKA